MGGYFLINIHGKTIYRICECMEVLPTVFHWFHFLSEFRFHFLSEFWFHFLSKFHWQNFYEYIIHTYPRIKLFQHQNQIFCKRLTLDYNPSHNNKKDIIFHQLFPMYHHFNRSILIFPYFPKKL